MAHHLNLWVMPTGQRKTPYGHKGAKAPRSVGWAQPTIIFQTQIDKNLWQT